MDALPAFGLLFLLCAILAWIDIRHGIIPDWLNAAIAGLGLANVLMMDRLSSGLEAVAEGLAIGRVVLDAASALFLYRDVQGLGLGDVKFLAAAGIWVGIAGLPMLLLIATLAALACTGLAYLAGRTLTAQTSLSFGPFLAAGLLATAAFQEFGPYPALAG